MSVLLWNNASFEAFCGGRERFQVLYPFECPVQVQSMMGSLLALQAPTTTEESSLQRRFRDWVGLEVERGLLDFRVKESHAAAASA